jgi:4-hydroxybenzoate polyprenyltransferase
MFESKSGGYFHLLRFPLIFTVWSDVLTGCFIMEAQGGEALNGGDVALMLAIASGLCTGGMTLYDCFQYESDKEHGKARTLPIGVISAHAGFAVAFIMILCSVAGATLVSPSAGLLSVLVALFLVVYASLMRGMPFLGAASLALSRGFNIILGMAFAHRGGPLVLRFEYWAPIVAVVGYVLLVTQLASEEAHARRGRLFRFTAALILILVLLHGFLYVSTLSKATLFLRVSVSLFVAGVVARFLQLAHRCVRELSAESVEKLVVAGLVATIVLNANFVAFTGKTGATFGVLFLLLPTFIMFRFFHRLFQGTWTAID